MEIEKADVLISSAEEFFHSAQNESLRSHEDAVTHLICHHSRQSIMNYLQGFLLRNDIAPQSPPTMAGLLEQCRGYDARFDLVDISPIDCRFETHDRDYCLEKGKVDSCFEAAKQVRNIITADAPGF